ncbi:hypothetical protein VZT92_000091 [Zoarces viviparus]|uniref:Uncharacterized protein n=1 Tax=Zoarces viviparus TaxID=48416 RepID=A0AAW1G5W0_ZOAVI
MRQDMQTDRKRITWLEGGLSELRAPPVWVDHADCMPGQHRQGQSEGTEHSRNHTREGHGWTTGMMGENKREKRKWGKTRKRPVGE